MVINIQGAMENLNLEIRNRAHSICILADEHKGTLYGIISDKDLMR